MTVGKPGVIDQASQCHPGSNGTFQEQRELRGRLERVMGPNNGKTAGASDARAWQGTGEGECKPFWVSGD